MDDTQIQGLLGLNQILHGPNGYLKAVPSAIYAGIDPQVLRLWTHFEAVYGLPTIELVEFIRTLIGDRSAIEIGSGCGPLGRSLGIPLTDNHCQNIPEVAALYLRMQQPRIRYPTDVENLGALDAVAKYKPQVVVGSWITQISKNNGPGNIYGVDEEALLSQVETYILFGSLRNHSPELKRLRAMPHQVIQKPWMWSRAPDSALFVWDNPKNRALML